ncbi:hypothetical protein GCM10017673_15940 [Streptosporangium violaceochromogenes]|nr:hypothetical protein GCM10017673_15940 [Streptosporangium violaceochromogenes]
MNERSRQAWPPRRPGRDGDHRERPEGGRTGADARARPEEAAAETSGEAGGSGPDDPGGSGGLGGHGEAGAAGEGRGEGGVEGFPATGGSGRVAGPERPDGAAKAGGLDGSGVTPMVPRRPARGGRRGAAPYGEVRRITPRAGGSGGSEGTGGSGDFEGTGQAGEPVSGGPLRPVPEAVDGGALPEAVDGRAVRAGEETGGPGTELRDGDEPGLAGPPDGAGAPARATGGGEGVPGEWGRDVAEEDGPGGFFGGEGDGRGGEPEVLKVDEPLGRGGRGRGGLRWAWPWRREKDDGIWPEESAWEIHRPWPLDDSPQDELPPSARWYGAPAAPPPRRAASRLRRLLVGLVAAVAGAGVGFGIAVLVPRILLQVPPPAQEGVPRPARVSDPGTGVGYPLPAGWRVGAVPPVTGFTSMASGDEAVTVMTGPADPVTDVPEGTARLADLYGRLLLHGDKVSVVEDRTVTVGGRKGHSRSLRAEYSDVVNRPSYLRVVLLTGLGGRPVVVIGVAQPDLPHLRATIDTVVAGVR